MLAREDAGSNEILAVNGLETLRDMVKAPDCTQEVKLGITRIFASVCKGSFKRVSPDTFFSIPN